MRADNFRSRGYILANLATGAVEGGRNIDRPVQLASFTKLWTAATILDMGAPFKSYEMRRYLSRSDNDMGVVLAAEALGMNDLARQARRHLDGAPTSNTIPAGIRRTIESRFSEHMMDFARKIGMTSAHATTTSGMNWDGTGPTASPRDAAKLLSYLYNRDGGRFLKTHASPDGGHTMHRYLGGRGVIGAKSGTLPGSGVYAGGFVVKGHHGQPYAAFFNTTSGGSRIGLASALVGDSRNAHPAIARLERRDEAPTGRAYASATPAPIYGRPRPQAQA